MGFVHSEKPVLPLQILAVCAMRCYDRAIDSIGVKDEEGGEGGEGEGEEEKGGY